MKVAGFIFLPLFSEETNLNNNYDPGKPVLISKHLILLFHRGPEQMSLVTPYIP